MPNVFVSSHRLPSLDVCEEVVLLRMYGLRIIGTAYLPMAKIEAKVEWVKVEQKYNCSKDFDRVMDRLRHHGLASDHGKSRQVAGLTPQGVSYAFALIRLKKYPDEVASP
jgi:hypothetical protein